MKRLAVLLLAVGCSHVTPKATVLGKRVALGELQGSGDAKTMMEEAVKERFELDAEKAELHLHVEASTSTFDEPVYRPPSANLQPQAMPMMVRKVQTLKVTFRLVEDATGTEKAVGMYELQERGPERPMGSQASDDLGVILSRRAVQTFIEEHRL